MPVVQVKGFPNPISFPDDMEQEYIRDILVNKFPRLPANTQTIEPTVNQNLYEQTSQKISDYLYNKGIISDKSRAHESGKTLAGILGFLGAGGAYGGSEVGIDTKEGNYLSAIGNTALEFLPEGLAAGVGLVGKTGKRFFANQGEANLDAMYDLLADAGKSKNIGAEEGKKVTNGISKYTSPYGSTRYVKSIDGKPVSSMQIMSQDGKTGQIANVFTIPEQQKKGLASELMERARQDFDTIEHSEDLTEAGARFANKVEGVNMSQDLADETGQLQNTEIRGMYNEQNTSATTIGQTPAATSEAGWAEPRRIRGDIGFLDEQGRQAVQHARSDNGNLYGLPSVEGFTPRHNPQIAQVAKNYVERMGGVYKPSTEYAKINVENSTNIANEFEKMKHNPQDPEVKEAYAQMIKEVKEQYQAVLDAGLKVDYVDFKNIGDPYDLSPRQVIEDINENNHMYVFSTRDGFGSDANFDPLDNPLLEETEFMINGKPALANDLFRVVHDYFGHAKEGVGFRASGEENTWRSHAAMFSPLARRAMTTETRGQNSWLNYGKFGDKNRTARTEDTIFADQKIGLLPKWVSDGLMKPK